MFIAKLDATKVLTLSQTSTNYVSENNAEKLLLLFPTEINGNVLTTCTIQLKIVNQDSIAASFPVTLETELYNGYLQAHIPITSDWTYKAGDIKMWIKISNIANELVLKSNEVAMTVTSSRDTDGTLPSQIETIIEQLEADILTKADDLSYESNVLQLKSKGNVIGTPITISSGGTGSIVEVSTTNGNILIDDTETTVYTLPTDVVKTANIIAGNDISISKSGSDVTINSNPYDTNVKIFKSEIKYPRPLNYNTIHNVSTEAELVSAISSATAFDVINLTANITLTSTLVINKPLKIDGSFTLQSAGTTTDPVTLISITGNNVYITDKVTIKHLKTSNTTVECAVSLNAIDFISNATIEFMEFGYMLKGSFTIGGKTTYTGALANNHRHFGIYNVSAPSEINGVTYDFPTEATPRCSFIYLSSNNVNEKLNSILKVANCSQLNSTKVQRQFYLQDAWVKDVDAHVGLIFENNQFNDLNGGIGLLGASEMLTLDFFSFIGLIGNNQGDAAIATAIYKGMLYIDGSGAIHDIGDTEIYSVMNTHPTTLRTDYTSVLDDGGIAYKNTVYTDTTPLLNIDTVGENNSVFNYLQQIVKNIDNLEEFANGAIYIGEKDVLNSWQLQKVGQGLVFSRFQDGSYVPIYTIENSSTTDNYFINRPEGRLAYITDDKKIHTLIKSSSDLKGCQLNNVDGMISFLHNGTMTSYCPTDIPKNLDITQISEADGISNAKTITSYSQQLITSKNLLLFGVNEYYVTECKPDTTARIYITDKATGDILGQSCSYSLFIGGLGAKVSVGVNKIDLSEPLPILGGKDIVLNVQFSSEVKLQGMTKELNAISQFYARFNAFVQQLLEENMATKEWVDKAIGNIDIDLNKSENINVISQGDIKYTHLHDIPFRREADWIPNEYIFLEMHTPAEDISACTYFTIKAIEPYIENYTDVSVKFRLKIEQEGKPDVNIDCVACTGISDIYNKLTIPVTQASKVSLWCNCLDISNGKFPNNNFNVGFYTSTGSELKTTSLFDSKTGLVNEVILPTSSGNKFNEIKLYDVPDESYPRGAKTPTISYDSENFGYTAILGANSGKGMGVTLGNVLAEFDIMTNAKNGLRTWYLKKSVEIGIGENQSETPIEGTTWTRKFPTQPDINAIIGFVFLAGVGTKINIKMKSMLNEEIVVNKDFSFDKVKTPASPSYAIVSDGVTGFTEVSQGDYVLEVTLISGSLYGVDFPYCTLVMGKLGSDYLVNRSSLVAESVIKTNPASFVMDTEIKTKIASFKYVNEISSDHITIPKFSNDGFSINSIGDNVFTYDSLGGVPVYIDANITEVGTNNFRNEIGSQVEIHISPNNTETWKVFSTMGYKIIPIDAPPTTTTNRKSVLKNDENGVIDWIQDPVRDGCVYLSDKNRIRSIDLGVVFEVLANSIWIEIGRFSLS